MFAKIEIGSPEIGPLMSQMATACVYWMLLLNLSCRDPIKRLDCNPRGTNDSMMHHLIMVLRDSLLHPLQQGTMIDHVAGHLERSETGAPRNQRQGVLLCVELIIVITTVHLDNKFAQTVHMARQETLQQVSYPCIGGSVLIDFKNVKIAPPCGGCAPCIPFDTTNAQFAHRRKKHLFVMIDGRGGQCMTWCVVNSSDVARIGKDGG